MIVVRVVTVMVVRVFRETAVGLVKDVRVTGFTNVRMTVVRTCQGDRCQSDFFRVVRVTWSW